MDESEFFDSGFRVLTSHPPLGWQRRLFTEHFVRGEIPTALDIPTGLGKTSVIVIWLLALAWQAEHRNHAMRLPRRLVYVVNRRTVVDQATDVAQGLRQALRHALAAGPAARLRDALASLCIDPADDASPLAISTLRGELADNREWQADPARPAIIVGTIDMIGSRLLFSGYGVSRRMRPFHAGLIGQGTLLVHDEAHLSPAFGVLARDIAGRQRDQRAPRPLIVMELSATQRERNGVIPAFRLTDAEKADPVVAARLNARKRLRFIDGGDDGSAALAKLTDCALAYLNQRKRILVYVRKPGDAKTIAGKLLTAIGNERVALLTGTIRGYERDKLAARPLFEGFRAQADRISPEATEYLVATSAGEVGVDLDADHMVCDLATLDSMIQRLGRVNRLGGREANVHVLELPKKERKKETADDLDKRLAAAKEALALLPEREGGHDASPAELRALAARTDAFAPTPRVVPVSGILLDNWSLTRVDDVPGRPEPERWLHGIEETGESDLHVVWRAEVDHLIVWDKDSDRVAETRPGALKAFYRKHRVLARERLRGPRREVKTELERIARRNSKGAGTGEPLKAVLLSSSGDPIGDTLSAVLENERRLANATIVLPPEAGGLDGLGILDGAAAMKPSLRYDVADLAAEGADGLLDAIGERSRVLVEWMEDEGRWSARRLGSQDDGKLDAAVAVAANFGEAVSAASAQLHPQLQKELIVLSSDEGAPTKGLVLFASRNSVDVAQDNPAAAPVARLLVDHLTDAREAAETLVERIGFGSKDSAETQCLAEAVILAAHRHDLGKNRDAWQADIGNPRPRRGGTDWKPLAKSGGRAFVSRLSGSYRHEFGSLREAASDETIARHPERDLILHLIAAHHGWARPHFRPDQWDIADDVGEEENAAIAAETMRRFARLQRRFGHWGLAWLEALVRAADYTATERLAGPSACHSASRVPGREVSSRENVA
jgi:CRISPR-associated endonuclease/helicase Cas3